MSSTATAARIDQMPPGRLSWRRIAGRAALCAWFLFLTVAASRKLLILPARLGWDIELVRLAANGLTAGFLVLAAWLTAIGADSRSRAGGWQPWVTAVLGTHLMLFGALWLKPCADPGPWRLLLAAVLTLVGVGGALVALLRLGCSFSIVAEARGLVTGGPYRLVRHPLYLAEMIGVLGTLVQFASVEMTLLVILQILLQLRRMAIEEALLAATFPEYAAYRRQTRRLIPGLW